MLVAVGDLVVVDVGVRVGVLAVDVLRGAFAAVPDVVWVVRVAEGFPVVFAAGAAGGFLGMYCSDGGEDVLAVVVKAVHRRDGG